MLCATGLRFTLNGNNLLTERSEAFSQKVSPFEGHLSKNSNPFLEEGRCILLTLLHSERAKLYTISAFLHANGLSQSDLSHRCTNLPYGAWVHFQVCLPFFQRETTFVISCLHSLMKKLCQKGSTLTGRSALNRQNSVSLKS